MVSDLAESNAALKSSAEPSTGAGDPALTKAAYPLRAKVTVLPVIFGARKIRKIARSSQDRIADANALATETLGAVRTVQAHAREGYERGIHDHDAALILRAASRSASSVLCTASASAWSSASLSEDASAFACAASAAW